MSFLWQYEDVNFSYYLVLWDCDVITGSSSKNTLKRVCVCSSGRTFILDGLGLQLYLKRVSGTGVFLWILRNFWENLFYRTPLGNCFCIWLLLSLTVNRVVKAQSSIWSGRVFYNKIFRYELAQVSLNFEIFTLTITDIIFGANIWNTLSKSGLRKWVGTFDIQLMIWSNVCSIPAPRWL